MIRMVQSQSAAQAKRYFSQSLRQSDYYLNDQEYPGYFKGKLAERLGLPYAVNKKAFFALCENRHPKTGNRLTQRNHTNRRIGYDINFHCPKSVSILHVLSKDDHILKAFQDSIQNTMLEIEEDVQTRVRKGKVKNTDENRQTGSLVWAEFIHQTARPVDSIDPDPHLHSHCFTFNATWDDAEQRFKAGEFGSIKRDMPYYQAKFHKYLSDNLLNLGYRIRRTDTSFEIVGVPQPVIDLFSKRTNEIGQIAKTQGITNARELDGLGARTRAKKKKGLTMSQLKASWRRQIESLRTAEKGNGQTVIRHPNPSSHLFNINSPTAGQCINHAIDRCFERASVMDERRLLAEAYRHAMGQSHVTPRQITEDFRQDKRIIRVNERGRSKCSTQAVLDEEKHMVKLAQNGVGSVIPIYSQAPTISLEGAQKNAVKHVLTSSDKVSIIQGRAGTGKTTLMKEANSLIEQSGRQVIVVAPTSEASRGVLRQEGFEKAETVAQFLSSLKLQKTLQNNVLWVDEAGLLGTKEMTALLEVTEKHNARLILSGDTRQHSSVVRGDALRILNSVGGIRSAHVDKIFRQRNGLYRKAVQSLADGNAKQGFEVLNKIGAVREIDPLDAANRLADEYIATRQSGKSALVVCPTHKQGEDITQRIRDKLRNIRAIGKENISISRLINSNMTEAEKRDKRNYKEGQIIQFNVNAPGFKRGSRWKVTNIQKDYIQLEGLNGKIAILPTECAKRFEVLSVSEMEIAKGDALRITRNGSDLSGKRLNNGQRLDVVEISENKTIKMRNSQSKCIYEIAFDHGHLAHAYCMTSHASQGKTVDAVFIYQPSTTFAASNLKQFYVSVSRGRESIQIFTDDREELFKAVSESGDRMSALELQAKKEKQTQERVAYIARQDRPIIETPNPTLHKTPSPSKPKRSHEPTLRL
ncbi:relaxase domain-containing protein [Algoriphagus sp. AGSA1]|uniref:MobF family relaxase n=1 Tax=Algoriphagus sp. AGSA1 TaxID=2907213 RepID=UPI001F202B06|nr:MobF family relaxase [Algoriphagus sp. AGSA1]MCE7056882.1 relaxase domain-containing protein [Algoriphagus sp. AGSA1]